VEDYASVLLRTRSACWGTIEVGNTFPRDGTDGEWKIAWRDGILVRRRRATPELRRAVTSACPARRRSPFTSPPSATRSITGAPRRAPAHQRARLVRVMRLVDRAYELAGRPYG
jgi:hypothetical protein